MRVLLALLLAALGAVATVGAARACDGGDALAWSQRYLQLRQTPGHFSGASWTPAVDAWGGEKHRLMQCLARHATATPLRSAQLRRLMDAPDERLRCPSPACSEITGSAEWQHGTPPAPQDELWLYHWRGRHDRLVLAISGDVVRAGGWLYVRE